MELIDKMIEYLEDQQHSHQWTGCDCHPCSLLNEAKVDGFKPDRKPAPEPVCLHCGYDHKRRACAEAHR